MRIGDALTGALRTGVAAKDKEMSVVTMKGEENSLTYALSFWAATTVPFCRDMARYISIIGHIWC